MSGNSYFYAKGKDACEDSTVISSCCSWYFNGEADADSGKYNWRSVYNKQQLPSFHLPKLSLEVIQKALPNAFTIAILAAIESLLSCVVADGMINGNHRSNMELAAQGAGNVASALVENPGNRCDCTYCSKH